MALQEPRRLDGLVGNNVSIYPFLCVFIYRFGNRYIMLTEAPQPSRGQVVVLSLQEPRRLD